jgi:hypothetical protein
MGKLCQTFGAAGRLSLDALRGPRLSGLCRALPGLTGAYIFIAGRALKIRTSLNPHG